MEWTPKAPTETVRYSIDWRDIYPDTIASYTLSVSTGTITLSEEDHDDRAVYVLVSGGVDGEEAELAHSITTAEGQALERTITLTITAGANPLAPTTTTKRQLIQMARENCGLSSFDFDASPEETASDLRRLDAMMRTFPWSHLGYNHPETIGTSGADDELGIPDQFVEAASLALAFRIAPGIGKSISVEAKGALALHMPSVNAYAGTSAIRPVGLPSGTPYGAGNKPSSTWQPVKP